MGIYIDPNAIDLIREIRRPPDIVLTTLNAKYPHAAFGLRYLLANLGPLHERATILEFEISQRPDALFARMGKNHGIALHRLAEFLYEYLCGQGGRDAARVAQAMWSDYRRGGRVDVPEFLRDHVPRGERLTPRAGRGSASSPARQARHLEHRPV